MLGSNLRHRSIRIVAPQYRWVGRSLVAVGVSLMTAMGALGCGSTQATPLDMSVPRDLTPPPPDLTPPPPDLSPPPRDPKLHPPLPQMDSHGGPVIKAAEIWTVVWTGEESLGAQVNRFHAAMLKSDYWVQSLGQYGVGAGIAKGVIVLPDRAPSAISDAAIESLISDIAQQPAYLSNKNTMYALMIPANTKVTSQFAGSSCRDYGGYHSRTHTNAVYSINVDCSGSFDDLTVTLSHEAAEAATDPYPDSRPGWRSDQFAQLGEVGDLCWVLDSAITDGSDSWRVTRLWSNEAAAAGDREPCVPADPGPFFGMAVNPLSIDVITDGNGVGTAGRG